MKKLIRRVATIGIVTFGLNTAWMIQRQTAFAADEVPIQGLLQEVYLDIPGATIAALTNAPGFPGNPSSAYIVTNFFEARSNVGDNYGQRLRAQIVAPLTGNYSFWISSDDASTLYLSTNEIPANARAIAKVIGWTSIREWTKESNQKSALIRLVAGQKYYIEALMKEGYGSDNLAVRWQLPNGTIEAPIPASRLWVYGLGPTQAAEDSWIWWEGEAPAVSNFPISTWLSPGNQAERDALSGGNIRTAADITTKGPYWASYTISVPQAGTYRLYTRKFPEYSLFKWRFDNGSWNYAGSQLPILDSGEEYKPYWPLIWAYLGDVALASGSHTFRIEWNAADWTNEPENISQAEYGGFDAFILSMRPFVPRGKLKPGEKYNLAEPGKWSFESVAEDFSPTALLDLRSLNERVAGQSGFVRAAGDQSGKFVVGDGTPVRFWGVNVGGLPDYASMSMQAKFLAKRGVNLVRYGLYSHLLPASDPSDINAVDPTYVELAHRSVAAFKQEGIYSELNFFWSAPLTIRKEWGVDGYTADTTGPFAILMFDEKLKAAYKQWVRQLFTTTNSYTGIPLAHDPAVAIIEIQNEDSFFWWSFNPSTFPQVQREKLEAKFGAFLIAKYGSLAAAQAAWGGVGPPPYTDNAPDAPASGRMALAIAWYMTAGTTESWFLAYTARMADQIRFLAELQRSFYQEMRDYFRNTLGCQSLIESSNWTTADERILLDVERYTYAVNDVIDKHPYFNSIHIDPNPPDTTGYAVSAGDYYQSVAVVKNPRRLPATYKQVAGMPHIASESTWVNPSRFKAEGPLLIAAYSSMADFDGWIWFSTGALAYEDSVSKFPVAVPSLMGQFPGAALLYRRGDVTEAPVAVREERNLSRMYRKELALISEFDPNRSPPDNPVFNPQTGTGRLDPLAMLVGKVECNYGTADAPNYVSPLLFNKIDTVNQIVGSLPVPGQFLGQLRLDWGKGIFQVNSPRSQGVTGFLNSVPQVDLANVTITSSNEFGAILVISLDNLPLTQSQKILIQAMTEDRPYGWKEQDQVFTNNNVAVTGKKIVSMGQPPMNVVNILGAVTLKGVGQGHSFAVKVLDENGYARGNGSGQVIGSDFKITLPTNSLYTVVLKDMNSAPVLTVPPDQAIQQGQTLTVTNTATDPDLPPNRLTFGVVSAPLGVVLDPATGVLAWTPTEAQGPSTNVIVLKVSDDGNPSLSATNSFTVVVYKPPAFTAQPRSQTVIFGASVAFNVSATGTAPLSYQWQRSVDGGANWSNLSDDSTYSGVRTATLMVSGTTTAMSGDQFRCVASNSLGSATSDPATLATLDGTLDTDGDGYANFLEVIAGTDPLDPASALRITAIREVGSNVELDFDSISGKMYNVEIKDALSGATWTQIAAFTGTVTGAQTVVDPGAGTGDSQFYRIKAGPNGEVVSDPAGYYGVALNAGPNAISVPLHNFATARGLVDTVTGNIVTVTGSPGWPANIFVPQNGFSQYILLVRKDASANPVIEGDWWTIASNTGNTLTLSAGTDVLSSLLGSGDQIEVRRLTSMKDLFGTGTTLILNKDSNGNAASGDFSQADVIRFISGTSFRAPIFYHDGTLLPAGYYVEGGAVGPLDGSTITVLPGQGFMVFRKAGSSPATVLVNGQVQVGPLTQYLKVGPNVIGLPFAADAPIGTSGLLESGWVSDRDGSAAAGDFSKASLLRLITGTSFGPSIFHHDGSILQPAGWYDANGLLNNSFPLQPGKAYIFFITAGNSVRWRQAVPYAP